MGISSIFVIGLVLWHTIQFLAGVFCQLPVGITQLVPQCEPGSVATPDAKLALAWLIGYAVSWHESQKSCL